MRNPLKRRPSGDTKPTLRERLAATRAGLREASARAGKAASAARILMQKPKPAPVPVDRAALITYASWLMMERKLVCDELFPHMAGKAHAFLIEAPGATDFHFPPGRSWRDVPPPSSRALGILDFLGVQWRGKAGEGRPFDPGAHARREEAVQPRGWPSPDATLIAAAGDAQRVEAAILALVTGDDRDMDDIPGFPELDDARDELLATLLREPATSLSGLQAKASGFDLPSQKGHDRWLAKLGVSIARDLLHGTNRLVEPMTDPVFEAIKESKRLSVARSAALHLDQLPGNIDPPEQAETREAFFAHVDDVLLVTVPRTAAGCAALSRYALDYHEEHGCALDESWDNNHHFRILDLIARSPLL